MFWVLKEPFHWDDSYECPQHMFWLRNQKNNFQWRTFIWRPVFFSESSHAACKIKQEWSREHNASKYSALLYNHNPRWGQKVKKIFFSEEGHVAYQIKGKEV